MGYSTENLGSLQVTTRRILMLKDPMELEEFETAAKSSVITFLSSLRQLQAAIIRTEDVSTLSLSTADGWFPNVAVDPS
jgi:hypothetical protein